MNDIDIIERPILFVTEQGPMFPYTREYTKSGLPFYYPPHEKNQNEEYSLYEFIFLPIPTKEWDAKKSVYFFGYRFLMSNDIYSTIESLESVAISSIRLQVQYEITRIRFYPTSPKSIQIDKSYDALFPTQCIDIISHPAEAETRFIECINGLLDMYCTYYVDKKI